jgi:hypothetical protein
MSGRLGTILVTILAVLGGIGGFLGSCGYFAYVGASKGMTTTCRMLQIGESKQLITHGQRTEMAKLVVPPGEGDEALIDYFMGDCSKSVFEATVSKK